MVDLLNRRNYIRNLVRDVNEVLENRRDVASYVSTSKITMSSDRIVGIDLGTTNSLVAFMQGENPVVIPGDDGVEPGAVRGCFGRARSD